MSEDTGISWTDHTFNPWWGCARVSPGCELCYAEVAANRYGFNVWGTRSDRRFFGDKHWNEPVKWDRAARAAGVPALVFCASMADVFEDRRDLDEHRARLWSLIQRTPNLRWQVLTKRPENVRRLFPWHGTAWPKNLWLGVTAENQEYADRRIPLLLQTDAPVKFVSYEPALGPIDFNEYTGGLDWIIVGGESGARARPFSLEWARSVVELGRDMGIPVFVKQLGSRPVFESGYEPKLRGKADNPAEWPADLRVQEFPEAA